MNTIPANLILEKNKIASGSAWLVLAEITFLDSTIVRLVRNTEDITFESNVYTAFPFEIDTMSFDKDVIPSVVLKVSNITRLLQAYLESSGGGVGATVRLIVVNSVDYTADLSDLELTFKITAVSSDATWVSFTLGIPSPLNKRFPLYRYMANHCNWAGNFKGAECQYADVETICTGTLARCRELNNSIHFGGFIGLGKGGIRFA
jgi:phage-related protein